MSDTAACESAHTLAGAIALGEARDEQRDAYRRHVAGCARCLKDLGGEREIERTMRTVAQARASERWEPDVRARVPRSRAPRGSGVWAGLAAAAVFAAVLVWFGHGRAPVSPIRAVTPQRPAEPAAARAVAALGTQAVPRLENRADLIAVGPAVRSPKASGLTAAFAVGLDAKGRPVSCTITSSSGEPALDAAVCRAAMAARVRALVRP